MFDIPVTFICFNRFDIAKKTFNKIKKIKPKKLYLIMDYPRDNNELDILNCNQIKKFFETEINWECSLTKDYAKKNLGLKKRIISGLNFVYSKEIKTIVLEDDCYPHDDFFYFCKEMLDRYENEKNISFITGNNFQDEKEINISDYYFSKYSHIWGWASWRDTWKKIIFDDGYWVSKFKNNIKFKYFSHSKAEYEYWKKFFYSVLDNKLQSWSIYLLFTLWDTGGLTVTPNINLIENLDLEHGTNTKNIFYSKKISFKNINKPLKINNTIKQNIEKDSKVFCNVYSPGFIKKINNKLRNFFK
jgi:hypothetical protein